MQHLLRCGAIALRQTQCDGQDDCAGYLASVKGECRRGEYGYETCRRACGVCMPRNATAAAAARAARRRAAGRLGGGGLGGPRRPQRRRKPDSKADPGDRPARQVLDAEALL